MTAINFPDNPSVDDEFTVGTRVWRWDGVAWRITSASLGPAGPQGPEGPQGPPGSLSNLIATNPIMYNSGTSTLSFDPTYVTFIDGGTA